MKKVPYILLALILVIGGLLVTGCGGDETTTTSTSTTSTVTSTTPTATTTTATQKYGGKVTFLDSRLPATSIGLPAKLGSPDMFFMLPALERLFRLAPDDSLVPFLATGYTLGDDMLSITITLQQGVKFHDGTDFNAEACKWNLESVQAGGIGGTEKWTTIEVIDDYTVKVNLKEWSNLILSNFTSLAGCMVSPTSIQTNGEEWAAMNIAATGPFKLKNFERDTILEFEKFNDYWKDGKPYVDEIVTLCMPDPMTQIATLQVGDADIAQPWIGFTIAEMKDIPGVEYIYSHSGVFVLYPDDANADSPLANKLVREAIEYAIDKDAIMAVAGFGVFERADQVPAPGAVGFLSNITPREYNPEKAKELLAEAGYPDGFETTIAITIPAPDIQDAQVAIAGFLEEVGITCELIYADPAKYSDMMANGWHNTMIYSPSGASGNYLSYAQSYYMVKGYYVSLKGPDNMAELFEAATLTPEVEAAMVEKVTKAMFDDCSLIPVSYMGTAQVYWPYLKDTGYGNYSFQMNWDPENVWLDK